MATTGGPGDRRAGTEAGRAGKGRRRTLWGWAAVAAVLLALAAGWYAMDSGPYADRTRSAGSVQPPASDAAGTGAVAPPPAQSGGPPAAR